MKLITLLLAAFFSMQAFAQTDSTETLGNSATYTSITSLTRADIERLPATTFMQLVQGAFPFIGSASQVEEDYTFLVEGFVAINPNAINLSQIESIHFYPAGTAFTRGSLGKRGTFVIRMQPQKSGLDVATKTGVLLAQDNQSSNGTAFRYKTGFISQNELSYRYKGSHSFLSSAVSYLHNNNPELVTLGTAGTQTVNTHNSRIRLSNIAGLQLGQHWKLEGGLFLTTQPQEMNGNTIYQQGGEQEQTTTQHTLYVSAHAGLQFSPTEKISNRIVAEMSYAEGKNKDLLNGMTGAGFNRIAATDQFLRYFAFSNYLTWKPLTSSTINLESSLVARYRFTRGSEDNITVGNSGGNLYSSGWSRGISSRSFALSPGVVLHLRQLLTAEAGVTYDDYGHAQKGKDTYKKLLPNGGLRLELASLLPGSGITSLELSSSYQRYMTSYDRIDLLGTGYATNLPEALNLFNAMVFANPQNAVYTPSETWVSSLAVGWWKNRVLLKGSYRIHDEIIRTYTFNNYGTSTPTYIFFYEPLTFKNWSVELKTVLMQKPDANWTLSAMVFHDKYERKNYGNAYFVTTPVEALDLDAGKAPLRGGLRTALTVRRFYLQAAALLNLNEAGMDKNGVMQNDRTTYRANFLLAGYTWPLQGKRLKGIDVNIQSQNLLHSNTFSNTSYLGFGVQVHF